MALLRFVSLVCLGLSGRKCELWHRGSLFSRVNIRVPVCGVQQRHFDTLLLLQMAAAFLSDRYPYEHHHQCFVERHKMTEQKVTIVRVSLGDHVLTGQCSTAPNCTGVPFKIHGSNTFATITVSSSPVSNSCTQIEGQSSPCDQRKFGIMLSRNCLLNKIARHGSGGACGAGSVNVARALGGEVQDMWNCEDLGHECSRECCPTKNHVVIALSDSLMHVDATIALTSTPPRQGPTRTKHM